MPPEQETTQAQPGEGASLEGAQITPELLKKVVDKVLEMLLRDLQVERERLGGSISFQRRRGVH